MPKTFLIFICESYYLKKYSPEVASQSSGISNAYPEATSPFFI